MNLLISDSPTSDTPPNSNSSARTLRVANIIEDSRYGGPQHTIVLVAEGLIQHQITTTVICSQDGSERFCEELEKRGVPHRTMSLHRFTRNPPELLLAILLFPIETLRLARLLLKGRFDLVQCNGSWQWKGVLASWLARTPFIWNLNDTYVPGIVYSMFRRLAPLSAGFIVVAERVRRYYLGKSPENRLIFEVQAPVDCALFSERGEIDAEIAALPGIKVITIANLNPAKGLDTLVRVAAEFKYAADMPLSFVVIGQFLRSQKEYFKMLQQLQIELGANNLHFIGPRTDIPACLRAADIGLCSSVTEASPMAVWETAAAGVAIVATDVGDIAKFNSHYNFGYIAPVGDYAMLAKGISFLVENPSKRHELGRNGKKFAKSLLDVSACTEKHAKAYRSTLVHSRSGS